MVCREEKRCALGNSQENSNATMCKTGYGGDDDDHSEDIELAR